MFFNLLSPEHIQLVIGGAAGGVVRWLTLKEPWRQGLVSVIIGLICARYLGPIGIPLIEPVVGKLTADPQSSIGLSGFVIGIGGISVSGFVLDIWNAKRRQLQRDDYDDRPYRVNHDDDDRRRHRHNDDESDDNERDERKPAKPTAEPAPDAG